MRRVLTHVMLSEEEQSALAWLQSAAIGGAQLAQSFKTPDL